MNGVLLIYAYWFIGFDLVAKKYMEVQWCLIFAIAMTICIIYFRLQISEYLYGIFHLVSHFL